MCLTVAFIVVMMKEVFDAEIRHWGTHLGHKLGQ